MLGVGVEDIVSVVCVIMLEWKSVLNVLHVRYVLSIKVLQLVSMRLQMGMETTAILYLSYIYLFFQTASVTVWGGEISGLPVVLGVSRKNI